MISQVFTVVVLATAVAALRIPNPAFDQEWESFKRTHLKSYPNGDELIRRFTFDDNAYFIREFNKNATSFTLGINQFTDMTNEEFRATHFGFSNKRSTAKPDYIFERALTRQAIPDTVDWRDQGYVTPVKNQGQCGSCWAFSTTGSLEGQHFKKTGKLVSLSEQNLVDCSTPEGNQGCNGGLMDDAFAYIKKNGGVDTEDSYPYTGVDGKCAFQANKVGATVTGFADVKTGDEEALRQAVATVGPVSVAIDASSIFFQFYFGGVYNLPWCSSTNLDHGVLAVGYGTYKGTFATSDYWLVKNSWGASWGKSGYIMMSRNKSNQCGIATQASYPTV